MQRSWGDAIFKVDLCQAHLALLIALAPDDGPPQVARALNVVFCCFSTVCLKHPYPETVAVGFTALNIYFFWELQVFYLSYSVVSPTGRI